MAAPEGPTYTYTTEPPPEMTYEEYLALVAAIAAAALAAVYLQALPYMAPALTRLQWLEFLSKIWPIVEQARRDASDVARRFYDSERAKHVDVIELPISEFFDNVFDLAGQPIKVELPDIRVPAYERLDILTAPYKPEWFEEAMDAVVVDFRKPQRDMNDVVKVLGAVQKEIENGTRRTTRYAVEDDPAVKGWARVEGNENVGSCAFCAMLISRGPVYKEAEDAGLFNDVVREWHPNCDCKVVPVFDRKNWEGRDAYLELEKLWGRVTKNYLGGKGGGDKLNAFRRYLNDEPYTTPRRRRLEAA